MSSTESKKLPAGAPSSESISSSSAAHPYCSPGLWNNKSGFFSFPPSRTNLAVMKMSTASYCLHPACRKQRPRSPLSPSTLRFRAQSPPGPGGSQKSSCMGMGNPWGTCFLQQHRMSQLRANPKAPLVLWESPGTLWHRSHLPKTWFRGEFPSGQLPARRTEGLPHGAACASPEDPTPSQEGAGCTWGSPCSVLWGRGTPPTTTTTAAVKQKKGCSPSEVASSSPAHPPAGEAPRRFLPPASAEYEQPFPHPCRPRARR